MRTTPGTVSEYVGHVRFVEPTARLPQADQVLVSFTAGYLVNLSQAVGRLILAGRDLTRFAGYTSRVSELFEVLEDIKRGRYERTMVAKSEGPSTSQSQAVNTNDLKGKIVTQDGVIIFDRVPIVTPNNDVLVKELSFKVTKGTDVIIAGPNGNCMHAP